MLFRHTRVFAGFLILSMVGCSPTDLDNQLPTVSITSPSPFEHFEDGDVVFIQAEASDPDGKILAVTFFVGDRKLGSDTEPPYTWNWDTSGEPLQKPVLRAVASDDGGANKGYEVEVEVDWTYHRPEAVTGGWEVGTPEDVAMDAETLVDLVNILRRDPEHLVHSILIVRHGKLVLEKYFNGFTHPDAGADSITYDRETRHPFLSVTKSVTSALLGAAIQQGFIDGVDERAFDYFPENEDLRQGGKTEITLEHLATMTSGLEWDEWTLPLSDTLNSLTAFTNEALNNRDAIRWYLAKPLVAEPGSAFAFSGGSMDLLGEIIGRSAESSLVDFAQEYLLGPLGIQDFSYREFPSGLVDASEGLELRPRDAAKFGRLFLDGGVWDGVRLLPPDWVDRSRMASTTFPPSFIGEGMVGYGYGWWLKNDLYGEGAFGAWGEGGQDIIVLPAYDMVFVFTGGSYSQNPVMTSHEMVTNYVLGAIQN